MDNSQGMQHLHPLRQLLLENFVRDLSTTILHREFDAVIVADYVVGEGISHMRSNLQGRGYFVEKELSQNFINLKVESCPVLLLDLL